VNHRIRARAPRGVSRLPALYRGPDEVATYLRDAAQTPGGHTPVLSFPTCEAEVAEVLKEAPTVLPIGAQSSLTGGATPLGEWVMATSRWDTIAAREGDRVRVGAGVSLVALAATLRPQGYFFPPEPTFRGALIGGAVSTNAAGSATFKYGTTRTWVEGLTVVLATGDVLDLARGTTTAHEEGYFEVVLTTGEVRRVPVPTYRLPDVPKCSAGYYAAPQMDLVDLFIGSEGTLGIVTEVEVRVAPEPPRFVGWLPLALEGTALQIVRRLREASIVTRATRDPHGIDVSAIEFLDARCLQMLREDGGDRESRVPLPAGARAALLFQIDLPAGTTALQTMDALAEGTGADHGLSRLLDVLAEGGHLEALEVALPGERERAEALLALREAVPLGVNRRVADIQRAGAPQVRKTAGDMIVPFAELAGMLAVYRDGLTRRGLDHAIWGHVSDGNLHVNVIPRGVADVVLGDEAMIEFGREVIRRRGSPLAEHGVGRNPQKQELLRLLYGDEGVEAMRRVKASLDPEGKLSPGVLWPR